MGEAAEDEMEREDVCAEFAHDEWAEHKSGTCQHDPVWCYYCALEQGWFNK